MGRSGSHEGAARSGRPRVGGIASARCAAEGGGRRHRRRGGRVARAPTLTADRGARGRDGQGGSSLNRRSAVSMSAFYTAWTALERVCARAFARDRSVARPMTRTTRTGGRSQAGTRRRGRSWGGGRWAVGAPKGGSRWEGGRWGVGGGASSDLGCGVCGRARASFFRCDSMRRSERYDEAIADRNGGLAATRATDSRSGGISRAPFRAPREGSFPCVRGEAGEGAGERGGERRGERPSFPRCRERATWAFECSTRLLAFGSLRMLTRVVRAVAREDSKLSAITAGSAGARPRGIRAVRGACQGSARSCEDASWDGIVPKERAAEQRERVCMRTNEQEREGGKREKKGREGGAVHCSRKEQGEWRERKQRRRGRHQRRRGAKSVLCAESV